MPRGERRVALHKTHLTTRSVAHAACEAKRYILWDDALIGFGVRVSPTGRRSFIVQYRARVDGHGTANRKQVLGHFPTLAVHTARRRARELLRSAALAPRGDEGDSAGVPTLRAVFESYLAARPTLAPQSRASTASACTPMRRTGSSGPSTALPAPTSRSAFARSARARVPRAREEGRLRRTTSSSSSAPSTAPRGSTTRR